MTLKLEKCSLCDMFIHSWIWLTSVAAVLSSTVTIMHYISGNLLNSSENPLAFNNVSTVVFSLPYFRLIDLERSRTLWRVTFVSFCFVHSLFRNEIYLKALLQRVTNHSLIDCACDRKWRTSAPSEVQEQGYEEVSEIYSFSKSAW